MVEACVSAYAQTVAMCPGNHWVLNDEERARQAKDQRVGAGAHSAKPERLPIDLGLSAQRNAPLYLTGNAFALRHPQRPLRDQRTAPDARRVQAQVGETGEVFYTSRATNCRAADGGRSSFRRETCCTSSFTLRRHPLVGETPLQQPRWTWRRAALSASSRLRSTPTKPGPSFILSTDQT
jgi:hypothetical protein